VLEKISTSKRTNNASTRIPEMFRILFSWLLPKKYMELPIARVIMNIAVE
jgi:hypothetical protein